MTIESVRMRARAAELRAEARRLIKEAESAELAETHALIRQRAADSTEARAATMCRPVWKGAPRLGGPWVVVGIDQGCFVVSLPPSVGGEPGRHEARYCVRNGWPSQKSIMHSEQWRALGQLDAPATLAAWRGWCARRRAEATLAGGAP